MEGKIRSEVKNIVEQLGLDKNVSIALELLMKRSMGRIFKRSAKDKNSEILFGSKPVYDSNSEEALIGITLAFPEETAVKVSAITPDYFFDEVHKLIWEAIVFIKENDMKPTTQLVKSCLYKAGHDDEIPSAFVDQLPVGHDDPDIIVQYVQMVAGCYQLRSILGVFQDFIPKAYNSLPVDAISVKNEAILRLEAVEDINEGNSFEDGAALAEGESERMRIQRERNATGDTMLGMATGWTEIDDIMLGLQAPELTIVAARPGMGKSAWVLCLAWNLVNRGIPVGFFSLEMVAKQLIPRLWAIHTGRHSDDWKLARVSLEEEESFKDLLKTLPFFLQTEGGMTVDTFRQKATYLVKEKGVKLLIIDYLQLMSGSKGRRFQNREAEVSHISREIKKLCMELGVPVIALSQLSRAVETRGGSKRPQLSDLRESGAIEQDADNILFIYRAEYYNIVEDADGNSLVGMGETIIAKHRNGALATVKMSYDAKCTRWGNYDDLDWDSYSNDSVDNAIDQIKEDSGRRDFSEIFGKY
jgi:replicative DNA helicase